ncbi:hypothetical protein DTI93_02380 [Parasaccharibacter sp. TMW 2.1884]|uniref:hypothetical protein n=1 Tax=Parasaccharibacter sp. TMW 2.1884 TaxID=2267834 RepID=UPI001316EE63|nr:hypothetical protein [Parasaccharibacter sp. TMW 2.1884]MCL1511252.1 hypothetical protein [Parasaccharibacter sp. TMW 2.1884]QGT75026.1 hypothetical protein GN304_04195 [Bombella sp. ESL0368]
MLDIKTFGPQGGNVLYKALSHPLVVEGMKELEQTLQHCSFAVYDPEGYLPTVCGLYPALQPSVILTHDSEQVGQPDGFGGQKKAVVHIAEIDADAVLALSFDDARMRSRLGGFLGGKPLHTLGDARLPDKFLPYRQPYLDKCNFATNFAFFRETEQFSTRLVTANYWSNYGAETIRYWLRLFDVTGHVLAEWFEEVEEADAGVVIDSRTVKKQFGLPDFVGQLFIHVIGAKGHDVVKYALDSFGRNGDPSLSVTHDANAWPSMRFATLPAPDDEETVRLWIQNSHGTAIPSGAITLNPMGEEEHRAVKQVIGPYETVAVDVGALFPDLEWPAQLELRSGQHLVRPRYEVVQRGRTRIAHMNVERADLLPDPAIRTMSPLLGRGFVLPFPVPDPAIYTSFVQPTPMSEALESLPMRLDLFDEAGQSCGSHFLGNLPRNHQGAVALHELMNQPGHAELVYDFRDGGEGDGWPHALMRYRHIGTDHAAETSFGGHIFNTMMTWRNEPQSYAGPPPGLTTRLFLKLGQKLDGVTLKSFCHLIYPTSLRDGRQPSRTCLHLHAANGAEVAQETISIQPSGSWLLKPHELFDAELLQKAGEGGYVLIRDLTCRLFGYHGLENGVGSFSLDHMFGF